jgi:NAD(P)-dependent dehydrogenase (short-subunit alcohol dehydrogenase family)
VRAVPGLVLITGASTGIGWAAANALREKGFDVLAGVRKAEDAARVREAGLRPLTIDVTDSATIAAAAEEVGAAGPLRALVNNAGVAISGPVEYVPIDEWRNQLEINLIGQIAVTQAFLPLLRAAPGGRIVNISSIGGRIALPLAGPYAASKFALEAASDSLRRELRGQGIHVALVEPGGVKTPIWEKGVDTANQIEALVPPEGRERYAPITRAIRKQVTEIATKTGMDPSVVADAIVHAVTSPRPRTRYLLGRDARLRWAIAKRVPDRWFDALIARALR